MSDDLDAIIARARGNSQASGVDAVIKRARRSSVESQDEAVNPFERAVITAGLGATHGLRKLANWSFASPSAPEAIQDSAVREEADRLRRYTEGHTFSGKLPAFIGEMVGPTAVLGPLSAPAKAGWALRGLAGAAQGYLAGDMMAEPKDRQEGLVGSMPGDVGAVIGGTISAGAPPLLQAMLRGGKRASEGAVKLFQPSLDRMREIAEKWRGDGETIEQGVQRAGAALRQVRGASGKRLVSGGQTMGERAQMLDVLGEKAGAEIDAVLAEADAAGARVDPVSVLTRLQEIRNKYFSGPIQDLTSTQREGRRAADDFIQRYRAAYGEHFKDLGPVMGDIKGGERPLAFPRRDEAGNLVLDKRGKPIEDVVVSMDQVGKAAPDKTRVFSEPEAVGVSQKRGPKGQFTKGEPNPQPHLQDSRVVETPAGEMSTEEGLAKGSGVRLQADEGAHLPPRLRKWLDRNGIDTREVIPQDALENGNIRRAILDSGELSARQKRLLLKNGTVRDPEIEALRSSRWRQEMMVDPDQKNVEVGRLIGLNQQPPSAHEAAKRVMGKEGFLRGSKYFNAEAASEDPGVQFFRQGYATLRDEVEKSLSPAQRARFLPAKEESQLAQVFSPTGEMAALSDLSAGGSTRSSLKGEATAGIISELKRRSRPYTIQANEILESMGKGFDKLPAETKDVLRSIIINKLRNEEAQ